MQSDLKAHHEYIERVATLNLRTPEEDPVREPNIKAADHKDDVLGYSLQ